MLLAADIHVLLSIVEGVFVVEEGMLTFVVEEGMFVVAVGGGSIGM